MAEGNEKQEVKGEQEVSAKQEASGRKKMNEKEERTWAMFCHLGGFAGFIVPFGGIIAPLVIWLTKKEDSSLVDDQGKESLNFQISLIIYYVVGGLLSLVVIGFLILAALVIFQIIFLILAATKANNGERFRYPLSIKFIK